jgi:hypothetical protein
LFSVGLAGIVAPDRYTDQELNMNVVLLSMIRAAIKPYVLPSHLTVDELEREAYDYMVEYSTSADKAVRDVIDEYHQGAAEEADARRNGDWDYGQE